MSAPPDIAWSRQLAGTSAGQVALWALAALVILSAHAAAGWWAMRERPLPVAEDAAPAIMVELASLAMAPQASEEQVAMDAVDSTAAEAVETPDMAEPVEPVETVQPEALFPETVEPVTETAEAVEPEPVEDMLPEETVAEEAPVEVALAAEAVDPLLPVEAEPVAEPEVTAALAETIEPDTVEPVEEVVPLPTPRPEPPRREVRKEPPKKQEQTPPKKRKQPAPSQQQTKAQVQVAEAAPRAAAPQASSGSGASVSPARWQSRLMAHLERRKRYPAEARRAGREGTAQVRFLIDANGNVASVSLMRSSGVAELDAEVVALVHRASPVPAPPPGVSRTIVVPIRFSLR